MAFVGLVANRNLADAGSAEIAWDNLGAGISYTFNNVTTSGVVIRGADILAITGINRVSARDLLLLQGLTSNAQTRLNTISQQVASGVVLQNNALLRASPSSIGNYSLNGNLSAQSIRINGVPVQSLTTSPFSGATAIASVLLDNVIISSNFTVQNTTSLGTISSPEVAIPVADGGYIYYLRAGQS
jgi:hypothetical protein